MDAREGAEAKQSSGPRRRIAPSTYLPAGHEEPHPTITHTHMRVRHVWRPQPTTTPRTYARACLCAFVSTLHPSHPILPLTCCPRILKLTEVAGVVVCTLVGPTMLMQDSWPAGMGRTRSTTFCMLGEE